MTGELDIGTRIHRRLLDWSEEDADWRAQINRAAESENALRALRDLYKEIVDEDGGCDHSVGICGCGDVAYLQEADVALGLAHWCECTEGPDCCAGDNEPDEGVEGCCPSRFPCDKCHETGIVYHEPPEQAGSEAARRQSRPDDVT